MNQLENDCASVRALLEIHALGTLSPTEADRIEEHVLTCRACDNHLKSFTDYLPLLGMSAAPLAPSAAVRASLLATIDAESETQASPLPRRTHRTRRLPIPIYRMRFPAVFSVPTIGLLLILGVLTVGSQYQPGRQRDQRQTLEQQGDLPLGHSESLQLGKATFGSDVSVYAFQTSVENSDSTGLLLTGPDRLSVLISLWSFVPSPAPLHVVFGSAENGDVVLGKVTVDSAGSGSVQVTLPDVIDTFDSVRIMEASGDGTGVSPEMAAEFLYLDVHTQILDESEVD